jgi:hypothetical protein
MTATLARVSGKKLTIHRPPVYNPQPHERAHVDRLLALANGRRVPKHGSFAGTVRPKAGTK